MRTLLQLNIILLFWAAPVTAFRSEIHTDFASYVGQYDVANIARFILTLFSFCICLAEISLRLTIKPQSRNTPTLMRGHFPFLFSLFLVYTAISIFYSMNIIFGTYMYVQLFVSYLSVFLLLSDFRFNLEKNIKSLINSFLTYSLVYIIIMLVGMLVDFNTVCPAGGHGTIRCVNTFIFPCHFGNLAAGMMLWVYSNWLKRYRIHWIEWAIVLCSFVWLLAQRTRSVMFAFVLALLFGIIMRFRGIKRILALTLLLVSSLALSLVAQEEIKTAQGFVLRSHESTLDTLAGRTRKWEVLLPLWATESPWFGFGFGAERHFRRHKEIYGEKIDAHSQFVFLLISGGLISLFLFLFWQISLAHRIFRVLRTASFTKLRTSTIFFGLFFLLITTQMFTSNPFMMHSGAQNILEAFVVLGLHATLCTEMTKKTPLLQHE